MVRTGVSRRDVLFGGSAVLAAVVVAGFPTRLLGENADVLEVASAGSIAPMLSGPVKEAVLRGLKLDVHVHSQGADAVAQEIVGGHLTADVFIPITAGPMQTVMRAGKAALALPVARTEMVIVYSPKSRFAARFEAVAKGGAKWWEVLQEPGLRFGRSNPAGDPGGRNIIFTMMLAAKKYGQIDLVQKVLGPTLSPDQILMGGNSQERLHSGELDASPSYKVGPGFAKLPYIVLPNDVNLSGLDVRSKHPDVSLVLGEKTFYPEPLVFYAAVLQNAANLAGSSAFIDWLRKSEGQALLRRYQFDPAGDAATLQM
jgi:molybdate/tungstate transport system substrate-binding protein